MIDMLNQSKTAYLVSSSYVCDCEGTGFVGDYCEEDIPECASDPCQNGATCLEGTNQYKCLCWPGTLWFNFKSSINHLSPWFRACVI